MAKKSSRSSGNRQFILGALAGAAAAYFLLRNQGPETVIISPGLPGRTGAELPGNVVSMAELPKYMFRPRTKMYL